MDPDAPVLLFYPDTDSCSPMPGNTLRRKQRTVALEGDTDVAGPQGHHLVGHAARTEPIRRLRVQDLQSEPGPQLPDDR